MSLQNVKPTSQDVTKKQAKILEEEEDSALKEEVEAAVGTILKSNDAKDVFKALEYLQECMLNASSAMASVPLPLKFLRASFNELSARFLTFEHLDAKPVFADIMSVLATTLPAKKDGGSPIAEVDRRLTAEREDREKKRAQATDETDVEKAEGELRAMKDKEEQERRELALGGKCVYRDPLLALRYRLQGHRSEDLAKWGDEYLRNLQIEAVLEYQRRQENARGADLPEPEPRTEGFPPLSDDVQEILLFIDAIVTYQFNASSPFEALDLLHETERMQSLMDFLPPGADISRITPYGLSLAEYSATFEEQNAVRSVMLDVVMREKQFLEAIRIALRMDDAAKVTAVLRMVAQEPRTIDDPKRKRHDPHLILKQIAFLFGQHNYCLNWQEVFEDPSTLGPDGEELLTCLESVSWNENLSDAFLSLAGELDMLEPKLPDDVFKSYLSNNRASEEGVARNAAAIDSARNNLAITYVNAFVNAGFCNDKLMLTEDSNWLYKNKDHGMMAASASTGAILMWQLESGLSRIDKYQWASESYVKAGAYMAFGLVSAGIRSQCDPAFALLMEPLEFTNELEVLGAVLGLGFALAGSKREDVTEYLLPLAADPQGCPGGLEVAAMAAVSLGLIFVGVGPCDASEALLQTLMELDMSSQDLLAQPLALYYGMALALIYQGTQSRSQAAYDVICSIRTRPFGAVCRVLMTASAYAASGDLLKIQHCLHVVTDGVESVDEEENQVEPVVEEEKPSEEASSFPDVDRAYAVIALALITMGDDVGSEMLMQLVNSLLQFGDRNVKQAISLALAVKSISHPQPLVVDLLTKMSHDTDGDVALHAIISLGLVGAGSNNSKIAQTLRQLASYYSKDVHATFITNISLGLVYLGKGLLTLSPTHSDGFLMRQSTLAHLQLLVFSCLLMNDTILRNKTHYLLWHAVAGARPKMADTLDAETLAPREVLVRVGQQVNTVGLAGKPRGVTAFQTHNTPILVNSGQRAELDASTTYVPLTPVIEGTVLVVDEPDD